MIAGYIASQIRFHYGCGAYLNVELESLSVFISSNFLSRSFLPGCIALCL